MKISFTKTITSVCVLTLLFALSLKAQKQDYVITKKGDTLKCVISSLSLNNFKAYTRYKTINMSMPKRIGIENIKEYYMADSNIVYRAVIKETGLNHEYMTVIESGLLNLYESADTTYDKNNNPVKTAAWYVSKSSDTVKRLKTTGFKLLQAQGQKDNLAEMLMDTKDAYDKYIVDDKFSIQNIRNIIHFYNTGKLPNDPGKPKDPVN